MNRYFFKLIFILMSFYFIITNESYACEDYPIAVIVSDPDDNPIFQWVQDTWEIDFDGYYSYDPDNGESPGAGITMYEWWLYYYDGDYDECLESNNYPNYLFSFDPGSESLPTGRYEIGLYVRDDDEINNRSRYPTEYDYRDIFLIDCYAECDTIISHGASMDLYYEISPDIDWSYDAAWVYIMDDDEIIVFAAEIHDLIENEILGPEDEFYGTIQWDGIGNWDYIYYGIHVPPGNYELWMYIECPDGTIINNCEDSFRVWGFNMLPAPIDEHGTKIMISAKHDDSFHTDQQTEDRKVRITVMTNPATANVPVYFQTYDPDDKSSYESDTSGGDNHHTGFEKGDLEEVSGYTTIEDSSLTYGSEHVYAIGVLTDASGVAEVDLKITDQYAGDNYCVYASPDPYTLGEACTDLLIAWKRMYLERDNMYKKGSSLITDFLYDGDSWPDVIYCDDTSNFSIGNHITIFDNNGNSINTDVQLVTSNSLVIDDIDANFDCFSGIKIQSESDTYAATIDYIGMSYGMYPDGSDGGVFVEFVEVDGGTPIPKYTSFPNVNILGDFCSFWFDHLNNSADCVQLVDANSISTGKQGATNNLLNISVIFDYAHTGTDKDKMLKDTVVHELGHQFGVSGYHVDRHINHLNHEGTDQCIMSLNSDQTDNKSEFCTDCIGEVRDQVDPL